MIRRWLRDWGVFLAIMLNDPDRKAGHGFVLAMMIEGVL